MRKIILAILLTLPVAAFSQNNFLLQVADSTIGIDLNTTYNIKINGMDVPITVRSKDTLVYTDTLFGFKYPKKFSPTKTALDNEID